MLETATNIFVGQKEISIFRTSIVDTNNIALVKNILDIMVGKGEWNFDLEDVDNILRIHANILINGFLTQELEKLGFECQELL